MPEFRYIGYGALQARALAALLAATDQAAEHLVGQAQGVVGVDEGTLQASITTDGASASGTGAKAMVYTGGESSEYAIFHHEGTGPHEIRATEGKALMWPGAAHPVKSVQHPGTTGTKFLERPLLAFGSAYRAFIAAAGRKVF